MTIPSKRIVWPKSQIVNSAGDIIDFFTVTSGDTTTSGIFILDGDGNIVDFSTISAESSGGGGGNDTYDNIEDFTATPTIGTKDVVLSGGPPFTIQPINVIAGRLIRYTFSGEKVSENFTGLTISGSTITFQGIDNFTTGDAVLLEIKGPNKNSDVSQDVLKTSNQNTDPDHYTDEENLVSTSDIGLINDTWKAQGRADVRTFKTVGIWVNYIDNDATGGQMRIMSLKNNGDTDVYKLGDSLDYVKTLVADDKVMYPFNTEGVIGIEIQTKATDIGIIAAFMTGSNNHQPLFAVWEAVTDGSFRITLNGTPYNIDGIDFTGITDLDGVASVAQVALRAATGDNTLTIVYTVPGFIFTANGDSDSSITALDTSTGVVGTDISGFPKASNIWFDAYDTDGVVTAATGTEGTVTIDITKEY